MTCFPPKKASCGQFLNCLKAMHFSEHLLQGDWTLTCPVSWPSAQLASRCFSVCHLQACRGWLHRSLRRGGRRGAEPQGARLRSALQFVSVLPLQRTPSAQKPWAAAADCFLMVFSQQWDHWTEGWAHISGSWLRTPRAVHEGIRIPANWPQLGIIRLHFHFIFLKIILPSQLNKNGIFFLASLCGRWRLN